MDSLRQLENVLLLNCVKSVLKIMCMWHKNPFSSRLRWVEEWKKSHELCHNCDIHEIIASLPEHGTSSHSIISKAQLRFWNKQRQQCGEARCFSWLQTDVLKVLICREWFGDCRWLKASMKMYPISSRLSSDHTVDTDAAFSFVVFTVVAVAAFLPHVHFCFLSWGVCLSWHQLQVEISSNRAGNWRDFSVCSTDI